MLLNAGDKLLVVHRRLFEKDEPRFFVGTVEAYEQGIARVQGYSFVRDKLGGSVARKEELRTKILPLASGMLLVYQLPEGVTVDTLQFRSEESMIVLTDGQRFRMNLSEWTARSVEWNTAQVVLGSVPKVLFQFKNAEKNSASSGFWDKAQ